MRTLTQASVRALIGVVPQVTFVYVRLCVCVSAISYTFHDTISYIYLCPHNVIYLYIHQDTCLFNDTLLHNIRYGNLKATMAEVEAAAEVKKPCPSLSLYQ